MHKLIATTRLWLHLQLICHAYMQVNEGCLRTRLLRYVCADSSKCETVKKRSLLLYLPTCIEDFAEDRTFSPIDLCVIKVTVEAERIIFHKNLPPWECID